MPSLLKYQKLYNLQNQMTPSVGDIVNIYNGKVARHKCLLGRFYDVITGKDDTVRGAKMFVGKMKKTVERPTNKLYPEEYFNKFIILTEDENIRYRPGTQATILADIKGKFSN